MGPLTVSVWFGVVEVEGGVAGGDAGEAGRGDREDHRRGAAGRVLQGGLRVVVRHLVDRDVVRPGGADHLDRPRLGGLGAAHPAEQQEAHRTQQEDDPPDGVLPDS